MEQMYREILENLYDGVYLVDHNRKITYWNKGAERISGYTATEVVGVHCWDDILSHVNAEGDNLCKGECPLAKTLKDGKFREEEIFLHHKNGHRLPVVVRVTPVHDEEGRITGAVEIFSDNSRIAAIKDYMQHLESLALLDPVTEVGNRRYAEMSIQQKIDTFQRYGEVTGILLFAIDDFTRILNTYGSRIGNKVLNMVAKTILNNLRSFDIIARWDEEKFIVLIMNVTRNNLLATGDRMKKLVEQSSFLTERTLIQVTISVGATLMRQVDSVNTLIGRADTLLKSSRNKGANAIEIG